MPKKLGPITVRFTEEQHARLQKLSASTGLDPAKLIRIAADGLLDYVDAHGGVLPLPLDFTTFFTQLRRELDHPALKVAEAPPGYRTDNGGKASGE